MREPMRAGGPIDEYINGYPGEVQELLKKMRQIINEAVPEGEEVIRYGMPTYRLKVNLVHFAAYKKHIGFYPTPKVIEAFKKDLIDYRYSKGAVQFPLHQPVPWDLVRRMVKYRVKEYNEKKLLV